MDEAKEEALKKATVEQEKSAVRCVVMSICGLGDGVVSLAWRDPVAGDGDQHHS